jgi:hypothetical protein
MVDQVESLALEVQGLAIEGRPLELRFPWATTWRLVDRYGDPALTRALVNRLRVMGAKAIECSTDPMTLERVIRIVWPEDS